MVIKVSERISGFFTNEEGEELKSLMLSELADSDVIYVNFTGVLYVTSSFANSAFADLLERMTFDEIKQRVRITGVNPQVADMIRRCLTISGTPVAA